VVKKKTFRQGILGINCLLEIERGNGGVLTHHGDLPGNK